MSEVQVFGSPLSPFVDKVCRALVLKKVQHAIVEPRGPGDFRRWSPETGKMPAMRIDGERVYDSTFICRALDERFPEPPLLSRDPQTRASQRLLEDWSDESLYWHVMACRWSPKNAGTTLDEITAGIPALLRPIARPLLKRQVGGAPWWQGLGRLPGDVLVRETGERLDDLIALLADRPFFFADEPSVADLSVSAMLHMSRSPASPEVDRLLAERPALLEYVDRVHAAAPLPG